jgi:hypothetical protein
VDFPTFPSCLREPAQLGLDSLHGDPDESEVNCIWERQSLIFAPMGKKLTAI